MAPTTRLREVLRLLHDKLSSCTIRVEKHRIIENTEYINLTIMCPNNYIIRVREFPVSDNIIRYAYQLEKEGEIILRYDNAPHHPELPTSPHHVHRKGAVEPLQTPSLNAFIKEVVNLIKQ